jgi:predicted RNA-binding protein YlxR (DUF448 family)
VAPKTSLRRVVLHGDLVVADPSSRRPGRGAYLCDAACCAQAVRRRAFHRSFRRPVRVADNLLESD